jgi:hypothetical protein
MDQVILDIRKYELNLRIIVASGMAFSHAIDCTIYFSGTLESGP